MNKTLAVLTLIAIAAGLSASAAFGQETFGTYRGGESHTGFVNTAIGSNLALQWQFSRAADRGNTSSPVVTENSVIFGLGKYVYSVSAATGALNWQYPKAGDPVGQQFNCPPAYANGKVYLGNDDGTFYAFSAATGDVVWQYKTEAFIHTAPVVDNGIVYFSSGDSVYALDAVTAKAVWSTPVKASVGIVTTPVVADGNIYVVDGSGTLFAATLNSGRPLWNTQVSGSPVNSGALVYDRSSLFFRDGNQIKVISARGGDAKSEIPMGSEISGPVTITDDGTYIVPTADDKLTDLDSHGRKIWTATVDEYITAPPLVTRTYMFVCTTTGVVYAIDRTNGTVKWDYTILPSTWKAGAKPPKAAPVFAAPVAANHTLYILSDDGTLSAFKESAPDNLQPSITALYPAPEATVSGKTVPYQVTVADIGSGVRPDSVALWVDGKSVPAEFDINKTVVRVKSKAGAFGQQVDLDTLPDGTHTAQVSASDWRGNKLTRSWSFKVDKAYDKVAANTAPVKLATPLGGGTYTPSAADTSAQGTQMPGTGALSANNIGGTTGGAAPAQSNAGGTNAGVQSAQGGAAQPASGVMPQPTPPANVPTSVTTIPVPSTGTPAPPASGTGGTGTGSTGTGSVPAGTTGGPPPPPPI